MTRLKDFKFSCCLILIFTLCSCKNDDNVLVSIPIANGSSVELSNTYQSTEDTMDEEVPIEEYRDVPAGSLKAESLVGESVEFTGYLDGLYDINLEETLITFDLVAESADDFYKDLFRTFPAGTFDRYYFQFDERPKIFAYTVVASSVERGSFDEISAGAITLLLDDTTLIVQIGTGFEFKPGTRFEISLD